MYCHGRGCEAGVFDDTQFMCPDHRVDLVPDPPPSRADGPASSAADDDFDAGSGRPWNTATCWSCGTVSVNPDNTRCLACPETLVPPRLVLTWADGSVRLDPGESVELGRQGAYEKLFRPNVSRSHAAVGVELDGDAWFIPLSMTNGTFRLSDVEEELTVNQRYPVRDGEKLRFARDVPIAVAVFALPDS